MPCLCACVCCRVSVWGLDDIRSSFVCVHTSLVVFPEWCPLHGEAVSAQRCETSRESLTPLSVFYFFPPHNGHNTSTLINAFIADLMRTVCGWLVKLFNFINLGWNLLCTRQTGVTYKRCAAAALLLQAGWVQ